MRIVARVFAVLLGVLLIQQAHAQIGGGFGGMKGGMRGGMRDGDARRDSRPAMPQRPADPEAIDDQLGLVEEALNLTQGQWPAWQRYADRVRGLAADIARERTRAETSEKQDAVQQIERAADSARNRLTALEDIAAAARTLYGALNPDQKSMADARLANVVLQLSGTPQAGITNRR
jgi:hypothetical protein